MTEFAATMPPVSVDHYENFPVASILCPPALRPAVAAIYWFARTADDIADEGDATPEARQAELAAYRRALDETTRGHAASRWPDVFVPLADALRRHELPVRLLHDLISAFEQDTWKTRYATRAELLDYCRLSANPVGRLLLHLYRVADRGALVQSDAVCTALQLINFWQDLGTDTVRGRLYLPIDDLQRHAVDPAAVLARGDSTALRDTLADLVAWARELLHAGAPLAHAVPGRAGWELRLVVQGGLRILEKIEQGGFATLARRPRLRALDAPLMLWRAAWMRAGARPVTTEAA